MIRQLKGGEVQSIMVTGDSILTGICIGKESSILSENYPVLVGNLSENHEVLWKTEAEKEIELPSVETLKTCETQLALSFSMLSSSDPTMARELMGFIRVYGRCTPYDIVAVVSAFVKAGLSPLCVVTEAMTVVN